jgi:hypothetical protein
MNRLAIGILAFALGALAGCPIPQTVPEYPRGTSVTPPRIVADTAVPKADTATIRVPAGCSPKPQYELKASLVDENTVETVEARWFVDYDKGLSNRNVPAWPPDQIPPPPQADPNAPATTRAIPPYTFTPYDFGDTVGTVHVVEVVVSNGFPPSADEPARPLPWRSPLPGFETQVYRWVFLLVTPDATVPCPP